MLGRRSYLEAQAQGIDHRRSVRFDEPTFRGEREGVRPGVERLAEAGDGDSDRVFSAIIRNRITVSPHTSVM
jgi:hypothetical protein